MNLHVPGRVKILWGAETIARKIGTSGDFVRDKLIHIEGSPVKKIGGRYCASEAELLAFFAPDRKHPSVS
ncbi:MAG: hypothetical protein AB7F09_15820 [Parvibaculaceae bacterium]